jgi:hypothetical protein
MQEAVRDRPPFGVIRGAMGGVWLGFLPGLRRKVDKWEKVTKKGRQNVSDGNFWRLVCVPKEDRQIFAAAPPPFQISKYATGLCHLMHGCVSFS